MKTSKLEKVHGRSIKGFDLHEALMKCKEFLSGFGGHTMAVGVSVKQDNLLAFKKKFLEMVKNSNISKLEPVLNIDKLISIDEINKQIVEELSLLEPYGEANEMPVFAFKELKIDSIKSLSEGKHLKLTLKSDKNTKGKILTLSRDLHETAKKRKNATTTKSKTMVSRIDKDVAAYSDAILGQKIKELEAKIAELMAKIDQQ